MNRLILFAIICCLSISIISCNKNDSPAKSNTDYITKSNWKFEKAMSGGADVSGFIPACQKDNIITFQATGIGNLDEGATKCNSGDPQSVNFNWTLTDSGTKLNVTGGVIAGQSGSFDVIILNDTQMILQGTFSTSSGNVTGQIYFKH